MVTINSPLPPRPAAIATLLTTDDFLPGTQTLLYSLKSALSSPSNDIPLQYTPEIIVLITPNISPDVRSILHPTFCTRLIEVDPISISTNSEKDDEGDSNMSHVTSWDKNCGYTKLHIFRLEVYSRLLYIDSDCLVVKDIRHLFNLGVNYDDDDPSGNDNLPRNAKTKEEARAVGLIAAVADIFPPDKFNAGVMLIAPSKETFHDMMEKVEAKSLVSYDGGDTGFLNAYFPDWYRSMPSYSRLSFAYNAQRFMYDCTYKKQPKYWDVGIGDNLTIIHYSSSRKPWYSKLNEGNKVSSIMANQEDLVSKSEQEIMANRAVSALDRKWKKVYERSQKFIASLKEEQTWIDSQSRKRRSMEKLSSSTSNINKPATKSQGTHALISKRFKELRKSGVDLKEAMTRARTEYEHGQDDDIHPGAKVASMFGMQV